MAASPDLKAFQPKKPRESKHPTTREGEMATIEDDDERLLAEIGYEQV
jgi:hypothetical protein